MEQTKARLKLTQVLVKAIRQGLTMDDIRKLFKMRVDARKARK